MLLVWSSKLQGNTTVCNFIRLDPSTDPDPGFSLDPVNFDPRVRNSGAGGGTFLPSGAGEEGGAVLRGGGGPKYLLL